MIKKLNKDSLYFRYPIFVLLLIISYIGLWPFEPTTIWADTLSDSNIDICDSNKPSINNLNKLSINNSSQNNTNNRPDHNPLNFKLNDTLSYRLEVIGSFVNIRWGPGIQYEKIDLVNKGAIFNAKGKRNSWYLIRLEDNKYGWIIDTAVKILPLHGELIGNEIRKVYGRGKPLVGRSGPSLDYPIINRFNGSEEFGVYLENNDKQWLLIASSYNTMGWIPAEMVKDLSKEIDFISRKEKICDIVDSLTDHCDLQKSQQTKFQIAGWFPSISLVKGPKDIDIDIVDDQIKASITLTLRKISLKSSFPLLDDSASLYLPKQDQYFCYLIMKSLLNENLCDEIEIKLKGFKKINDNDRLQCITIAKIAINKNHISNIDDIEKIPFNEFWQFTKIHGIISQTTSL